MHPDRVSPARPVDIPNPPLRQPALACCPTEVTAFLPSEDATFMTGANVAVGGGVSASNGQPPQE